MEQEQNNFKIFCFAGPNGSGKTSVVKKFLEYDFLKDLPFVNADMIAKNMFAHIENYDTANLAAARFAEEKRHQFLTAKKDFIFETVLSTPRNLDFLKEAKAQGAEINSVYVLTRDKEINVRRVAQRVREGGHSVPDEKIRARYDRCMGILPELLNISDTAMVLDNSQDYQTNLMFYKNSAQSVVFSNAPQEDEFLQETIVKPLAEKFRHMPVYCPAPSSFNELNIQSMEDLSGFVEQVLNDTKTVQIYTMGDAK